MAKPKRRSDVPQDRALQWSDLDRQGQGAARNIMRAQGNIKSRLGTSIDAARAAADNPANNPDVRHKSDIKARKLEQAAPYVRDKPVTLQGAASRRVEHFENGIRRSQAEGVHHGGGWYFDHHQQLAATAQAHGEDTHRVITASAAMSPQNSPENERAAVHALTAQRGGFDHDPKDLRRAGTKSNLAKAEAHLDTGVDPIHPSGSPKVHSYREATKHAVPGSPEHQEYLGRIDQATRVITGQHHPGQQRADLYGLQNSTEGILSPTRNTAEDTWMNTITYGQDIHTTLPGSKTNVGKLIGSDKKLALDIPKRDANGVSVHPSGQVGSSAVLHAYNNEATVRAARRVGEATGVVDSAGRSTFPAVAMQEVSWTEARRAAGKDPEYNRSGPQTSSGRQPTRPGKIPGQIEAFPNL